MKVKVCGLTDGENIRAIELAGADWFGFIFHPASPRYVEKVPQYLPERGMRVGVFVKPTLNNVLQRIDQFGLHAVQLYDVPPNFCSTLKKRGVCVIRALPACSSLDEVAAPFLDVVDYLLFDTPSAQHGGTGKSYQWDWLDSYTGHTPFVLSGGIEPASAERIRALRHPSLAAVDINSRFETSPGMKDVRAVEAFIKMLKQNEITSKQNK